MMVSLSRQVASRATCPNEGLPRRECLLPHTKVALRRSRKSEAEPGGGRGVSGPMLSARLLTFRRRRCPAHHNALRWSNALLVRFGNQYEQRWGQDNEPPIVDAAQ